MANVVSQQERSRRKTLFKKLQKLMFRPWKHRFVSLSILFLLTAYFFTGFGIATNPSFALFYSRSAGLEAEAKLFLKIRGVACHEPPHVFILTRGVKDIFYWPYVSAYKLMFDEIRYSEQISQSFSMVEGGAIVMQEEEMHDRWVLAHEVGHIAHYCSNPDDFVGQTTEQKEAFAENFREAIQLKLQSKMRTFR